ncbi:hypothetical protein PILCRDRAFT_85490 [Piloderma croceum F 1598]|uniref:C2H2-type domain-containing protein n=1 Tax=Piloderma croceum (strain F 1598) TaxID=765440 RepID=A0A0C3CET0_PILCF|nr:hypothetical protein PILCRDRAFT_85490 [Piloderma croceum F 1598]
MLGSSGSAHSYFDSLMIVPNTGDQHKPIDLAHLYCRQPYAVEIIQLVEVPAPARRFPIVSSSIASSSSSCYSSESESEYSSDDDDNAESAGSSYCSSDSSEQMNSEEEEEVSKPDETYDTRVTRVHAWRATFAKDMGIDILPIQHTKRKIADDIDIDEDDGSHSSKRSRPHHVRSTSALTTHTCAACDASFSTRQILRQHGEAQTNEACRIAVEYDFE